MVEHNYKHISINHSVEEYIKGISSTNGEKNM